MRRADGHRRVRWQTGCTVDAPDTEDRRADMWRAIAFSGASMLAASLAGCGAAAPPNEARTEVVAAIRAAEEAGAQESADAAYHLELAEAQLTRAQRQIAQGRMDRAATTLERAHADAELAVALAHEASAVADAEDIRSRIDAMRAKRR
jgi:hypothetical protein